MTAVFRDDIQFEKPLTLTAATGQRLPQFVEIAVTAAEIAALGLTDPIYYDDLPANVRILGAHIVVTTALGFSSSDTTGLSATIGNADADGFAASVALAGTAGYKRPAPGVLLGGTVAGGSEGVAIGFAATGPAGSLAHVNAGALKVVIDFLEV